MKGACYRHIQVLRAIPSGHWIGTAELSEKLKAQGIEIHIRSLQRDLHSLSKVFELENDGNKDGIGWRWKESAKKLELPEMEPSVALTFKMVRKLLEQFMPENTFEELSPYFQNSEQILNSLNDNQLSSWASKVSLVSRNQPLSSPKIDSGALSSIYGALLSDIQITAEYKPRNEELREYIINPHGLVVVDQIIYLIGTLWEYKDIKQFALHRFKSAKANGYKVNKLENFDLNAYIKEGHFEFVMPEDDTIKLKIHISKGIAKHLSESKLSNDQDITERDGKLTLTATTKNTKQLRWWLLGFGKGVEVIEPKGLREEFRQIAKSMVENYS